MMNNHYLMVIGGTTESHQIIDELLNRNINVILTVATSYGESLIEERPGLKVVAGRMDSEQMLHFIKSSSIECVVDASHPFAQNVSNNAIQACREASIPYVRFERKSHEADLSDVYLAQSYEEAAAIASRLEGNILLTTGSNNLECFITTVKDYKQRLFVRVLPTSNVIQKCEKLGLTADNIIAMKGPFSKELNREMLKQCKASVMVTKESGDAGGVKEKLLSAGELGAAVILIKRPVVEYINVFNNIEKMIDFIKQI